MATSSPTLSTNKLIATFNSVAIFGDSLSDQGNLFDLTGVFPPPPYVDGRFSNGDIWVDYFQDSLGLGETQIQNFAFGGATTGSTNALEPLVESLVGTDLTLPGLTTQIDSYINSLPASGENPNGLYVIWAGANDLLNVPNNPAQVPGFLANSISNIVDAISRVAAEGGDTFLVPNLPDLGLTPRSLSSGISGLVTTLTSQFNVGLTNALTGLETALDIDILEVDIFSATREIINSPADFGLTNVTDPLIFQIPPVDPGFFWWDEIHPTTGIHERLSDAFKDELLEGGYLVDSTDLPVELLNLSAFSGEVTLNVSLSREADFNNVLKFYQTDPLGRLQGLAPGEAGYEDAVREALLDSPEIFIENLVTRDDTFTLTGGSYYAPALLVKGDINDLVTLDDAITGDRKILREGNTWRFEDWIDFDFDDLVMTLNSTTI
jgi:phospholipase/lecithinase/hemolysin